MSTHLRTLTPTKNTSPGPGMGEDGRCMTCDGRYCGQECEARPGRVWVVGRGWKDLDEAEIMAAEGRTVYWDDTSDRFQR
jgi:hypothetical protein